MSLTPRLLLIEDEAGLRLTLTDRLGSEGYSVETASDGEAGLARATGGAFDLIVLEAFSSDVVPVNLLTKEALGQYLGRLKEGGAIAFHISNRYLELASVIAEVGAAHGLTTIVRLDKSVSKDQTR